MMNNKGGTYEFWIGMVLMIILFAGALLLIGTNMNSLYNQNQDYSFGLSTNNTLQDLKDYQQTLSNSTNEGQSSLTSFGYFILSTLPHMILTANSVLWNFVSGGFINRLVLLMNLGDFGLIVLVIFKLLYFLAIGFILMKIISKVIV